MIKPRNQFPCLARCAQSYLGFWPTVLAFGIQCANGRKTGPKALTQSYSQEARAAFPSLGPTFHEARAALPNLACFALAMTPWPGSSCFTFTNDKLRCPTSWSCQLLHESRAAFPSTFCRALRARPSSKSSCFTLPSAEVRYLSCTQPVRLELRAATQRSGYRISLPTAPNASSSKSSFSQLSRVGSRPPSKARSLYLESLAASP